MKILYKKTNFKKVGFSTMAFTAKILSWRFRHLNIVGCLLKRRRTKGGSRAPHDPLATPLNRPSISVLKSSMAGNKKNVSLHTWSIFPS